MTTENPYRTLHARMSPPGAAWDEGFAAGRAAAPAGERITHGRHCICSACAAEDWTNPQLAPCGMHGSSCPREYAPLGPAGRAAASPDPPDMTNMCEGESPDHKPGITPAASPDERLREALRDANEYLVQIADYSPSEVADAIDSVRAQIKDALAATDARGKPDGASVPDQSCATCGGSGDRNGNRRAADPFGTCPGCGGTGNVAAADREAPDGER